MLRVELGHFRSFADAKELVDAKLGGSTKSGAAAATVTATDPAALKAATIAFIARPNSVQTNLIVGTQAIARTSPDYDVLQVMNKIIGGGPTGRLFIHLREEKGYTYGAGSVLSATRRHSAATGLRLRACARK